MKALIKNAFSDYLHVEILAVILAAVIVAAVTSYIAADSIYKASIIGGGSVTPILGGAQDTSPARFRRRHRTTMPHSTSR